MTWEIPSLVETLSQIAGGVVGAAGISLFLERFEWFKKLSPGARFGWAAALTFGLPAAATLILQFVPAETLALIEPYWRIVAVGLAGLAGGQLFHRFGNKH